MSKSERPEKLLYLDRRVFWQGLFMRFELLWAGWARPLMVLALGLALVACGLLTDMPIAVRLGVLVAWLLLMGWQLLPLFRLPRVKRIAVLRKLENAAALKHRVVSSADDAMAAEIMDPRAEALWVEHKHRQLAGLEQVRLVLPQSRWRQFDPLALRVPVVMALVSAFVLGSGGLWQNLNAVGQWRSPSVVVPLSVDAWVKPPAYTGKPPLLLTSHVLAEKFAGGADVSVPEKSVLTLRVSGAGKPEVIYYSLDGEQQLQPEKATAALKENVLSAEVVIDRPLTVVVRDGQRELARWPLSTLPDAPPHLTLTAPPAGDRTGKLSLNWQAADDYGVRKITGEVELADDQDGETGFESNGIFLFDPPELKFILRSSNARDEKGVSKFDLAKHAWAGFNVTLNMRAIDAAGQEGPLKPVTFKMPERLFVKPLPRALIEQRKVLILNPEKVGHVADLLDTLNLYPKGLFEGFAPSIAMGAIASRLRNSTGVEDTQYAMDQMWELAVRLEDGSLSDLRAELKSLKEQLEKALREGAPQDQIAALMDKLRGAMDKYLDEMRKQAEKQAAEGGKPPNGAKGGKSVSREDLQKMLDELQDMSKGGDNDTAQQMLDKLDELLQNLQPGGQQSAGDGSMDDMMQGLGDMMKKQQRLMDETQRMPGEGQMPGEEGADGQGASKNLSKRQQNLKDMLDSLRGSGAGNGELDDAARAMGEAGKALEEGDKQGALQKQGEALDKLRRGSQKLAEELRKQGQGQQDGATRDGEGRGGSDDPLGRPRASRAPDGGPDQDMLPKEQAQQRAREILESLRAKANERGLSDQEKAYIDRLLRGLY